MYTLREFYDILNDSVLRAQLELRLSDAELTEILKLDPERVQQMRTFREVLTKDDPTEINRAISFVLLADTAIDVYDHFANKFPRMTVEGEEALEIMKETEGLNRLIKYLEESIGTDFLHTKRCIRRSRLADEIIRRKFLLLDQVEVDPLLLNIFPDFTPRPEKRGI